MKKITLSKSVPFIVLMVIAIIALFVPTLANFDDGKYSAADTAWIIVATALVFLMTPGLAFFYGGMVHRKNVLSTMIKSFVATGIVSILWVTVGYSLCFGPSLGGFIGNPFSHLFFACPLTPIIPRATIFYYGWTGRVCRAGSSVNHQPSP